jgi:hypothetical protein
MEIGTPASETPTPASTVILPTGQATRDGVQRPSLLALTFLAVAAAAFLVGIAIASALPTKPVGALLASERAGPAGATIRFDGGELRIPAGALEAPTRIAVRQTVVPERVQVRPPGGLVQVFDPGELVAFVFEPSDVRFQRPATLILRLRDRSGGAATFVRAGGTTLLLTGAVDADRGTVSVQISDFRFNHGRRIGGSR